MLKSNIKSTMIIFRLIKHNWLKNIRSKAFHKNLVVNIILGLSALYLAVMFLILGLGLRTILEQFNLPLNPVEIFHGATLYLILGAILFRFFMQQLNTIDLQFYQTLPIKRSTLVNFIIAKPLFSLFNYLTLLIVIPFAINTVSDYYGTSTAFQFIFNFIILIWFDSLFTSLLKRKFNSGILVSLILIGIIILFIVLEYFKVFSLFNTSQHVFDFLSQNLFGSLLMLTLPVIALALNKLFFSRNYYPEQFNKKIIKDNPNNAKNDLSFLTRFGAIGNLISLELKLILRHKRTKSVLYMSAIFPLFFGFFIYSSGQYDLNYGYMFFMAILIVGFPMMNFGQWIISCDGSYFDGLMTKNVSINNYLTANYFLLSIFTVCAFIFTIPCFFISREIIYMHTAALLYNIGVNIPLMIFFATYSTKRLELAQNSAFNYQGTSFRHFLIMIPILIIPMILTLILSLTLSDTHIGLYILAGIGLLGILVYKYIINLCVKQFNKRKYILTQGFRERE